MSEFLFRVTVVSALQVAGVPVSCGQCSPFWTGVEGSAPAVFMHLANLRSETENRLFLYRAFPTRVYELRGRAWVEIPTPMFPGVSNSGSIHVLDDGSGPTLYLRALISDPNGSYRVAYKRMAEQWVQLPSAFAADNFWPLASCDFGNGVHIYGKKQSSDLYRWNGVEWDFVASTGGGEIYEIIRFDTGPTADVYVIGQFDFLDGIFTKGFAKWNGQQWSRPVPEAQFNPGEPSITSTMVANLGDGPALYTVRVAVPGQVGKIFKYDGTTWSQFGGYSTPPGSIYGIWDLHIHDDGRGPALYIAGWFHDFGGVEARGIVRYDGSQYEALGPGSMSRYLATVNDLSGLALFVGGASAATGGGTVTNQAALWVGCPNCYANCDLSTAAPTLNIADFVCFLQKFAANDPYANCDNSSAAPAINIADFQCFLQKFAAGCP
jgi:hypothetical protein